MNDQELASLETLDIELEYFEPITRTRSNTWPSLRPEGFIEPNPSADISVATKVDQKSLQTSCHQSIGSTECSSSKRKAPTRNAHGSLSYSELITQAISAAKDQRLTLSEIYAWMIEHVPSVKDREESAGWRNSVRHNLSLHKRFVRVPNESAGKSSWWTINPNELFAKSTRRRSASMEAKKYQSSRSRAKRNAQRVGSEHLSLHSAADQHQLHRASYANITRVEEALDPCADANRSLQPFLNECSASYAYCGRLSPIPAVPYEAEWATEYYPLLQADVAPSANRTLTLKSNVETIALPIPGTHPYDQPPNEQTLTRFNSFLDDVTDIISKEMIDCKLKTR